MPSSPGTPATAPNAAINLAVFGTLSALFGANSAAMRELISAFFDDADRTQTEMAEAELATDYAALGALAHKLKGSAGTIGADQLGKLAQALEICTRSRESADIAYYRQQIESHLPQVRQVYFSALEELMPQTPAAS